MANFSIRNDYSILHNYSYEKKGKVLEFIDWLSTPCRGVLGGRNVDVLSLTYSPKWGLVEKISTIILSVIIFPIALLSILALIVKALSLPWIWQPSIIRDQADNIGGEGFEHEERTGRRTSVIIELEKQIPILQNRLYDLQTIIQIFEDVIKNDPDLREDCEQAWLEFRPHVVDLIEIEETNVLQLDVIKRVAQLQRKILNCRTTIDNYKTCLKDNPQLAERIAAKLRLSNYNILIIAESL